jgi:hypothetical protein
MDRTAGTSQSDVENRKRTPETGNREQIGQNMKVRKGQPGKDRLASKEQP